MQLIIDGKEYSFDNRELNRLYVGQGIEGTVYRYKDMALKIYKEFCIKQRSSEKYCQKMMAIPTKRIILPRGLIYYENGDFAGYYHEFIKWSTERYFDLTIEQVLEKMESLDKDVDTVSQFHLELNELLPVNFCYDGFFNFIDSGSYRFTKSSYLDQLRRNNSMIFNYFKIYLFACSAGLNERETDYLGDYFNEFSNIMEYLNSIKEKHLTISEYTRKLVK
jgi:hypothetical protein